MQANVQSCPIDIFQFSKYTACLISQGLQRPQKIIGNFGGIMPVLGLGLHILVALFFAVHAVRSGQQMYWLMILFSFPLFGSIVYFLVIYLPNSRLEYGARKAVAAAARSLDPTRELRE